MHPDGQRLLDQSSTTRRAHPGCVAWINRYDTTTSVLSFVRGVRDQLLPGCIRDALCQTMVLKHVPDSQVFKRDHAETVDQFTTNLMGKVFAPVGNALVDMLNRLAPFGPFGRSFFSPREKALHLRQSLLSMTKEAGIINLHPIGERGKTFKSYIHPDCQAIVGQGLGIHFTGEAGIPVAHRIPLNGECLDPALDGTMQDDPHCPNFGNEQLLARREQFKPRLLEGEARVPTVSPKARVARLFACLHSTKESLESQIHSLLNILQDLRMDTHQFGMISFPKSESFICVVQRKGFLFLLPGVFARGQRLVVDPTTKFQRPIELGALAPGGSQAILEGFYRIAHAFYFTTMSYTLQGCVPWFPIAEARGFSALTVSTTRR